MFYDDLTGADGQPPNPQEMAQRRQANQAAADPGLWERAEAHNPDPARFCPVQVTPPLRLSLTPTPTLTLSLSLSLSLNPTPTLTLTLSLSLNPTLTPTR